MKLKLDRFGACLSKIAERGSIGSQEAAQILQETANRAEQMRNSGEKDAFVKAAGVLGKKILERAQADKAGAIRNAGIRQGLMQTVLTGDPEHLGSRARSILIGTLGHDLKENLENTQLANSDIWMQNLNSELERAGLMEYARSPESMRDIAVSVHDLRAGKVSDRGPLVQRAAQIFVNHAEMMRQKLNGEGARIEKAVNYVAHTTHDQELMRRGGRGLPKTTTDEARFAQWAKTIQPLLADKTFENVTTGEGQTQAQANTRFLKNLFMEIMTGITKTDDIPRATGSAFEGSSNLARRLSEQRMLLFKDGGAWADYMKVYGKPENFYELMHNSLMSGARSHGLLKVLGTNPGANYRLAMNKVEEVIRDTHTLDQVSKFQKARQGNRLIGAPSEDRLLEELGAVPSDSIHGLANDISNSLLHFSNMTSLGSVGITHLVSLPTTYHSTTWLNGVSRFESLKGLMESMVPSWMGSADKKILLAELGSHVDGARWSMLKNPLTNGLSIPGRISALHSHFIRATGVRYIMTHAKDGMKWMLAKNLFNNRGRSFGELNSPLRQILTDYGIGDKHWDLLRNAEGENDYITPSRALSIKDEDVTAAFPGQDPAQFKEELANRIAVYYTDAARYATVTPGAREHALLAGQPGSSPVIRLITQFSSWPLAAMHQIIGRQLYENLSAGKVFWGLGLATAYSTIMGEIRQDIGSLDSGRPIQLPQNGADLGFRLLRDLSHGGALGILGDRLFGSIGSGIAGSGIQLGGAAVGYVEKLGEIAGKFANALASGKNYNPWLDIAKFARSATPFGNLPYAKSAFDYLVWYHLFEAISPGWWERANRTSQKFNGAPLAGYIPGAPVPSGIIPTNRLPQPLGVGQ